jgi:hypothetical protein
MAVCRRELQQLAVLAPALMCTAGQALERTLEVHVYDLGTAGCQCPECCYEEADFLKASSMGAALARFPRLHSISLTIHPNTCAVLGCVCSMRELHLERLSAADLSEEHLAVWEGCARCASSALGAMHSLMSRARQRKSRYAQDDDACVCLWYLQALITVCYLCITHGRPFLLEVECCVLDLAPIWVLQCPQLHAVASMLDFLWKVTNRFALVGLTIPIEPSALLTSLGPCIQTLQLVPIALCLPWCLGCCLQARPALDLDLLGHVVHI